jgi:hypothetical protein
MRILLTQRLADDPANIIFAQGRRVKIVVLHPLAPQRRDPALAMPQRNNLPAGHRKPGAQPSTAHRA